MHKWCIIILTELTAPMAESFFIICNKEGDACRYMTAAVKTMIKAGIIGSTGYAGAELARLLCQHEEAEVVWYGSRRYVDKKYYSV